MGEQQISEFESFFNKLLEVPLFKSAVTSACSVYCRVKGHNSLCHIGLSITEDALMKVFLVLEPLRKQYTHSMDAKLCHWLTSFEEEHPKMMVPIDQILVQSHDCFLLYIDQATDVICQSTVSQTIFDVLDWLLAWLHLLSKIQTKKVSSLRKGLRKIQKTRHAKTLKDFASPRRIVSPRKRVSKMSKWYHWLQGLDNTLTLQNGTNSADLVERVDKSVGRSPEDKKRKHDELGSESEVSLSEIMEEYQSEDDYEYQPPPKDEVSSTDSLEYKETSDAEDKSDVTLEELSDDECQYPEDDNQEFSSPIIEMLPEQ